MRMGRPPRDRGMPGTTPPAGQARASGSRVNRSYAPGAIAPGRWSRVRPAKATLASRSTGIPGRLSLAVLVQPGVQQDADEAAPRAETCAVALMDRRLGIGNGGHCWRRAGWFERCSVPR